MNNGEVSQRDCAEALLQRLSAASQVIMPGEPTNAPFDEAGLKTSVEQWYAEQSGRLLDALVRRISATRHDPWLWLVFTALAACYPTADELLQLRRALELLPRPRFEALLLRVTRAAANRAGTPGQMMDVLQDRVIVDVDFCAGGWVSLSCTSISLDYCLNFTLFFYSVCMVLLVLYMHNVS